MIELLDEADLDWIETLVDVVERNAGKPWRVALEQLDDLQRALQLRPPPAHAWQQHVFKSDRGQPTVTRRFRAAISAVQRVTGGRKSNTRIARQARGLVLGHPALEANARAARIAHAGSVLGVDASAVEQMLFCDLPRERPVQLPGGRPLELEVAAFANVALLERAVRRAQSIDLVIYEDDPGTIVRAAAELGLIVAAYPIEAGPAGPTPIERAPTATRIEIIGPLSLVRGTSIYGRALGRLVPLLADLRSWSLAVHIELPLASYTLRASSPVLLPAPPARASVPGFQASRIMRQLAKRAPTRAVRVAPPMLRTSSQLLFPDLLIDNTAVEIVSFWTPAYLAQKLGAYREIGQAVVLCVDAERGEDRASVPSDVLPYRKYVDIDELIRHVP